MATVVLVPDVAVEAGIAANYNSGLNTGNTYKFRNNGRTMLHFKKSGANACTVTIAAVAAIRGHAVAGETVTVPATTGDVFVGPLTKDIYADVNGDTTFTVSEVTGLTVAVIQLP
jgi:hypothetical protein